ncbi:hypothetical protein XENORESO_004030, partial [Xenotaenia resolanae]
FYQLVLKGKRNPIYSYLLLSLAPRVETLRLSCENFDSQRSRLVQSFKQLAECETQSSSHQYLIAF